MEPNDMQNIGSWLQAILKEAQETRGAVMDMQQKVNLIPEIRDQATRGTQDSGDAERKIDDTRSQLENKMNQLENMMNDLRNTLNDVRNKVDRLK